MQANAKLIARAYRANEASFKDGPPRKACSKCLALAQKTHEACKIAGCPASSLGNQQMTSKTRSKGGFRPSPAQLAAKTAIMADFPALHGFREGREGKALSIYFYPSLHAPCAHLYRIEPDGFYARY